jgi:hypothetical protein
MMLKIENIENEIDLRVESMISEIHNYRDEHMLQLDKYKKNLEEYLKKIYI